MERSAGLWPTYLSVFADLGRWDQDPTFFAPPCGDTVKGAVRLFTSSAVRVVLAAALALAGLPGASATGAAESPAREPTAAEILEELMQYLGFDASHREALLAGEILYTGMPDLEVLPQAIAVAGVMLLVQRPLDEVVDAYLKEEMFHASDEIISFGRFSKEDLDGEDAAASFSRLRFAQEEKAEIKKLLRVAPGTVYNLSETEMARFDGLDAKAPGHADKVTRAYRTVLLGRGRDYLDLGVAGIAPYARKGGKLASPRDELTVAVESARFLKEHFPDFHAALREFPEHRASLTESRCYWLKKEVDKRPVFILAHQLLSVRDNMALGAEREYYVGHTYNSMLMLIGVLPFEGGTLVFSANRVFTEKVTGFGSGLRKKLGRKVVGEKMARRFETVRTALERRQPATR